MLEGDIKGFFSKGKQTVSSFERFSKTQGKKFQSISILAIRRATLVYSRRHQFLWFQKKKEKLKVFL